MSLYSSISCVRTVPLCKLLWRQVFFVRAQRLILPIMRSLNRSTCSNPLFHYVVGNFICLRYKLLKEVQVLNPLPCCCPKPTKRNLFLHSNAALQIPRLACTARYKSTKLFRWPKNSTGIVGTVGMLHYPSFKVEHIHGNRTLYMQANPLNYLLALATLTAKWFKKKKINCKILKINYSIQKV